MPVWLAIPVWTLDLAASDGALVDGGETGQWAWDDPATGPVGSGACWGTNPDADYLHDTVDWLEIPLPDLSSVARPTLVLHHWYAIRPGDGGAVEVDGVQVTPAGGYPDAAGFVGSSGAWVDSAFDLAGFGGAPTVRLVFSADPIQADAGWYVQALTLYDGDVVAPVVAPLTTPSDTQDLDGPYGVTVQVTDDVGVTAVTLFTSIDGGPALALPMTGAGSTFGADIAGQAPDTVVRWWVEATDGENVGRWPASGEEEFRVFLAAPTNLAAPVGQRLVADRATITWDPPDSPHPVLGYRVTEEGEPVIVLSDETSASVPLRPGTSQRFTVTAEYEAGVGDPSEVLALAVEVPELVEVDPPFGHLGEDLWLTVSGASLYLDQQVTTLDLGPNVEVDDIDVLDVNSLVARVSIERDARPGDVSVTVGGAHGSFTFPAAFEVRDDADAPRIARIEPASLRQGDEAWIELEATVPFASTPTVRTDEDLFVLSDVTTEGAIARFRLAVSTRARIGEHTLEVDDGVRPYTVDLRVDEYVAPVQKGCSTAAGWSPLALLALRRRRSLKQSAVSSQPAPSR